MNYEKANPDFVGYPKPLDDETEWWHLQDHDEKWIAEQSEGLQESKDEPF